MNQWKVTNFLRNEHFRIRRFWHNSRDMSISIICMFYFPSPLTPLQGNQAQFSGDWSYSCPNSTHCHFQASLCAGSNKVLGMCTHWDSFKNNDCLPRKSYKQLYFFDIHSNYFPPDASSDSLLASLVI